MRPKTFGRYVVEGQIGDGGMGRVYRARDPLAHRVVAVKTIKAELLTADNAKQYLRRFRREAQAAGGLSHPNLVTVYDTGEDYFVMEYLEGVTLHAMLKAQGRLDLKQALKILAPAADALDYVHQRGIVHRDIKPANIMVLPDGRPKIMDFGLAHLTSTVMTVAGTFLGSPSYMAPEQVAGAKVTPCADLFSLAAVAYEVLTGKRAFDGNSVTAVIYKVMHTTPEPPCSRNRDLPSHLDDVFVRALSKDPARRFESAAAFVAALDIEDGLDAAMAKALSRGDATIPIPEPPEGSESEAADLPELPEIEPLIPTSLLAEPPTRSEATDPRSPAFALEHSEPGPLIPTPVLAEPPQHAAPARRRRTAGLVLLVLVLTLGASAAAAFLLRQRETPSPSAPAPTPAPSPSTPPPSPTPAPTVNETPPSTPAPTPAPPAKQRPQKHRKSAATARASAPVREGDLVELTSGVVPPRKISGRTPDYPTAALRPQQQGAVTVSMVITEKGEPAELSVLESAGPALDAAVLNALQTWRFEPARKNGAKVRVRWKQTFSFVVK